METNEQKAEGKKKLSANVVIIVLSLVVIILLCMVVWFLLSGRGGSPDKVKKNTKDVPMLIGEGDNAEDILQQFEDNSADTRYNCRMTYTWNFADGKAESKDAYVANTSYNHYPIYFEVQLDDTQEIVYTSALVPVGYEVNGITLDKELSAGVYPATVIYHLVDDDNEEVSSVGFTITIQVRK